MIAFISEERRDSSGGTWHVVVSEFREGQQVWPVVLLVVTVDAEVLFKGLVGSLGLSVAFRVIARREM